MRRWTAPLFAAALVAAACGGDEPARRATSPAPANSPSAEIPSPTGPSPANPTPGDAPEGDLSQARVRLQPLRRFDQPLAIATRRGDETIYVAEQPGRIRALHAGRILPVLDLSAEVTFGGEQGLLGIVFSPDGRFLYVDFTDTAGDTRVSEFRMRGRRAAVRSRRDILIVDQPFANHNGGQVLFGPDGMLYVALGDGGGAGDPLEAGQSLDTLLGKILRIDPRPSGGRPYRVPRDNPFVDRKGARPEIWAYGLRNPWRFTFDRETGDLWIGDVGQSAIEEVDFERAGSRGGRNYGWDRLEGTRPFEGQAPPNAVPPIFEYQRTPGTCAITGGYVYRGEDIPELRGAYVYADFCEGRLMALGLEAGKVVKKRVLGPTVPSLSSFGEDQDGELYVMSLEGSLFRLEAR